MWAHAYYKSIGSTEPVAKLFVKFGVPEDLDDDFIDTGGDADASDFFAACRDPRFWDRPAEHHMGKELSPMDWAGKHAAQR